MNNIREIDFVKNSVNSHSGFLINVSINHVRYTKIHQIMGLVAENMRLMV